MISSARIGASADKYNTRATLAAQMYGMNVQEKQFGYDLDYKYYATDSQTLIAQQQMPTMGDKLLSVVAAAAGSAGGMASMGSDERLKTDIEWTGKYIIPGVRWYTFNYINGTPSQGVLAHELEQVLPHAVFEISGIKHVNYEEIV
jgi:hypothetical protein